jgi:hypothetical protein
MTSRGFAVIGKVNNRPEDKDELNARLGDVPRTCHGYPMIRSASYLLAGIAGVAALSLNPRVVRGGGA